jgi:hypothetical protein
MKTFLLMHGTDGTFALLIYAHVKFIFAISHALEGVVVACNAACIFIA